ncbi:MULTISPECIES: virulence associated lipoprotein [Borreliella]|uniref:virulence associated lipoprotein n=3 Tax=Borreliella TaxID=64895 RepID=UPI000B1A75E8|nr:virulence associated lipoprotein [Borreliella valaisiana]WLN25619.1 virulence associated lipoprotein [Borreliella valaisiana]
MLSIELEGQDTVDSESDEQVFNIGIRAFNFINTFLTDDEIDEFTTIFSKPTLKSPAKVLNNITILEFNLEKIINHLFLKKDVLDEIKISDLKKIKNSLEQLFSIRKIFSTAIEQLLLDYQKNRSFIKTDDSKLKTYFDVMLNRFNERKTKRLII